MEGEERVEGEVVTIEAWLDSLRDLWGVAKPAAIDTAAASTSNSSDLLALDEEES